jgi:hypothetical protein
MWCLIEGRNDSLKLVKFRLLVLMPRLKTAAVEPRGSRTGSDGSAKATKAQPKLGGKKRSGNSPGKTIVKAPKERVFLTKDQQALLILRYMELPKSKQKKSIELRELCKEFDVNILYPGKLCAKLKETKELPTRDGVGGAPIRMTEEEVELLTAQVPQLQGAGVHRADQGSIRGVSGRQNRGPGANKEASCGLPSRE